MVQLVAAVAQLPHGILISVARIPGGGGPEIRSLLGNIDYSAEGEGGDRVAMIREMGALEEK